MSSLDITSTIEAKSDQVNAEDLLSGPRTVTITEVSRGDAEQPVNIHLAELPGKAFRPCKSMRRVLVAAWGPDAAAYVGRRVTLYRDASVKWAGQEIGGVRIKAMSHIDKRLSLSLSLSRGKRAPFVIEPLPDAPDPAPATDAITVEQRNQIAELLKAAGRSTADAALGWLSEQVGREVGSTADLSGTEAVAMIQILEAEQAEEEQ